jgi:hypothetical protein
MDISDDPAPWCFPSPAGSFSNPDFSETDFLHTQLAVIAAYVERFPWDEREFRALAWIEANAGAYRQQWQARAASRGGYVQSASGRGGASGSRTHLHGFAIRCITALLSRRAYLETTGGC